MPAHFKYLSVQAEADWSADHEVDAGRYQPLKSHALEVFPRVSSGTAAPSVVEGSGSADEDGDSDSEETGSEHWDVGNVRTSVQIEEEEEEVLPLAPRERRASMRTQSFMDRLKVKRSAKSDFGFNVNLAFKGALFVVLGNLPMLVRPLQQRFPPRVQPYLAYVGLYVVFTFWKNLGETLKFAFQGTAGIFLAAINLWIVTTIVGTAPQSDVAGCLVWLDLIAFVWLILWLNFDDNTRSIALSNHVAFMMLVLKPEDPENPKGLLKGFSLAELLDFNSVEVAYISLVCAGMLWSIIAAITPLIPVLPSSDCRVGDALRYAEDETRDLAAQMGQLVIDAVKGFGAQQESLVVDGFIAQSMQMHARLEKIDILAEAAWWEVRLPFTSHSSVRLRVLKDMHDILLGVIDNIIILLYTLKYEDFQPSHQDMMDEIEVPLDDLAQFFYDELCSAMDTLCEVQTNSIQSDARKRQGRYDVLRQKTRLITELGEAYFRTLEEMLGNIDGSEAIDPGAVQAGGQMDARRDTDLSDAGFDASQGSEPTRMTSGNVHNLSVLHETMEESHFVYRMILMVDRLITRLERQESDPKEPVSVLDPFVALYKHLANADQLFDMEHVIFAIRQSITIVVCFGVCKHYYHYSPTMVVTQALLVSEAAHTGSMLKKNLGRLQGVVIGTIFPHLFYDWFSECYVTHMTTLAIILFVFEWIALYVYYSSEDFGYVGCLVGGFGASALCQGCGKTANTMQSLYLTMEQNALGIAILTVIDMVFAPQRASDMAYREMCHEPELTKSNQNVGLFPLLQHGLAMAMKMDLHPDDQGCKFFQSYARGARGDSFRDWSSRTIKQLQLASKLCDEAYVEPRYMRRSWPLRLYQELLNVSKGLRVDVVALRDAIEGHELQQFKDGAQYALNFDDSKEFKRFTHKLHRAFNRVSHMVLLALKHFDEERGEQGKRTAEIHKEAESLKIPTDDDLAKLSRAFIRHPSFRLEKLERRDTAGRLSMRSHVLSDTFCRTSVAVCVLKNSTRRLKRLYRSVVDSL